MSGRSGPTTNGRKAQVNRSAGTVDLGFRVGRSDVVVELELPPRRWQTLAAYGYRV